MTLWGFLAFSEWQCSIVLFPGLLPFLILYLTFVEEFWAWPWLVCVAANSFSEALSWSRTCMTSGVLIYGRALAQVWVFLRRQNVPHPILSANYFNCLDVLGYRIQGMEKGIMRLFRRKLTREFKMAAIDLATGQAVPHA